MEEEVKPVKKRLLCVLIMTGLLLLGAMKVSAQGPEGRGGFLLLLSVPDPTDLSPATGSAEAYSLHAAEPVLERLTQLEDEALIEGFDVLLGAHAVRVATPDPGTLRGLPGVDSVLRLNAGSLGCAGDGAMAVEAILEGARASHEMFPLGADATNPSIFVYQEDGYGYVTGSTDPETPVEMVVRDASGSAKVTRTTTSSRFGYYSFYPDWETCLGYDWYPEPGDTVEVIAGGNTVSTTVVEIVALANPDTDTVSGSTAANRTVEARTDRTEADCDYASRSVTTSSDGTGAFRGRIGEGFDRSVTVEVEVYDARGNSTFTMVNPPHVALGDEGDPSGSLRPNVSFTAALKRGGSAIASFSGTTDGQGGYSGSFGETVQPGDVIEVSGGGEVVSTTFVALSDLAFDFADDCITGNLAGPMAGRTVRSSMDRPRWACQYESGCMTATPDGQGDFALDLASDNFDLQRGDDGSLKVFDEEGNYQMLRDRVVAPLLLVDVSDEAVDGYWREPGVVVTMTLRDAGGGVKEVDTDTTSSYNAGFYFWNTRVAVGDAINVTDGTYTLTLSSVPTLTANLDATADAVSGAGPEGGLLELNPYQFELDPDYLYYVSSLCYTATVTGGSYSIDFGGDFDARAQDYADAYLTAADGHQVVARSYALTMDAEKGGDEVSGYTPAPGTEVRGELWRGGSARAVFTTTSASTGAFSGDFENGGAVTITEGDTIKVTADGVPPYSLTIPQLTVEDEPVHNDVTGRAPPSAELKVELDQPATWNDWGVLTTADGDGNYRADFDGVYTYDCMEAQVGACTRSKTTFYDEQGHSVYVQGPEPPDVLGDAFEPDNAYDEATPYAGLQSHSFHAVTDTDWISFTVAVADVGSVYYLRTTNLGLNANTNLCLYGLDGSELDELACDTSYTPASSQIAWSPTVSGTYYVEVEPTSSYATESCGSTYDLFIARHRIYLPLVTRNG